MNDGRKCLGFPVMRLVFYVLLKNCTYYGCDFLNLLSLVSTYETKINKVDSSKFLGF